MTTTRFATAERFPTRLRSGLRRHALSLLVILGVGLSAGCTTLIPSDRTETGTITRWSELADLYGDGAASWRTLPSCTRRCTTR